MADETLIDRAQARIRAEEAALDAKRDAFETFGARVTNLQTDQTPSSVAGTVGAVGSHNSLDESGSDRCRTVRTAFAETVLPHSVVDVDETESLLETLREEFTPRDRPGTRTDDEDAVHRRPQAGCARRRALPALGDCGGTGGTQSGGRGARSRSHDRRRSRHLARRGERDAVDGPRFRHTRTATRDTR